MSLPLACYPEHPDVGYLEKGYLEMGSDLLINPKKPEIRGFMQIPSPHRFCTFFITPRLFRLWFSGVDDIFFAIRYAVNNHKKYLWKGELINNHEYSRLFTGVSHGTWPDLPKYIGIFGTTFDPKAPHDEFTHTFGYPRCNHIGRPYRQGADENA